MRGPHFRSTFKTLLAILCAVCFLTVSLGSVSRAIANDPWETWPKNKTLPGVAPYPETDADADGAAKAEEAAGKETVKGKSSGTIWWIAAGTAVVIGIAIAIAGGGGGGDSGTTTNPGHR